MNSTETKQPSSQTDLLGDDSTQKEVPKSSTAPTDRALTAAEINRELGNLNARLDQVLLRSGPGDALKTSYIGGEAQYVDLFGSSNLSARAIYSKPAPVITDLHTSTSLYGPSVVHTDYGYTQPITYAQPTTYGSYVIPSQSTYTLPTYSQQVAISPSHHHHHHGQHQHQHQLVGNQQVLLSPTHHHHHGQHQHQLVGSQQVVLSPSRHQHQHGLVGEHVVHSPRHHHHHSQHQLVGSQQVVLSPTHHHHHQHHQHHQHLQTLPVQETYVQATPTYLNQGVQYVDYPQQSYHVPESSQIYEYVPRSNKPTIHNEIPLHAPHTHTHGHTHSHTPVYDTAYTTQAPVIHSQAPLVHAQSPLIHSQVLPTTAPLYENVHSHAPVYGTVQPGSLYESSYLPQSYGVPLHYDAGLVQSSPFIQPGYTTYGGQVQYYEEGSPSKRVGKRGDTKRTV